HKEDKKKRKTGIKKKKSQRRSFWLFVAGNFGLGGFIMALLLTLGIAIIVLGGVVAIIASEDGKTGGKTEQVADGGEPTGGGSGEPPKVENPGNASAEGFSYPLSGTPKVTSPYGPRNLMGASFHKGTDFACQKGVTPILAAKKGKVGWAKFGADGSGFGGYGNVAVIEHEGGLWTLYGHMTSLSVQEGQQVEAGTQLGICGATGQVTGPHLHFEVKTSFKFGQVDPTKYLPK
ncbi:M23 family metallopeptidase, partial [Bacillus mycoides]|uniref:M23 family metallopeptidase n=1 Tax=Bacillus mycoides TaxID=1405 RepID=UPI003A801596